ncbi:restriction endonuclease subunit S [Nostoc sp. UHCC 0702]|nr:restriction endonuclease subunit S [Nostoc sp. UHCC 0702]
MSELPQGWAMTSLGDICGTGQYGWTTKAVSQGFVKYLRTTDITKGQIDWHSVPYCQKTPFDLKKYCIQENDILISRAGSVGFSILITDIPCPIVFASYLIRFIPSKNIEPRYVAYSLKSPKYWQQISNASTGIALANVNAKKLAELRVPVAPLNEQKRIADKLDALFRRVDACQERLDRVPRILKRFRQNILDLAVSGKLTESWREANTIRISNTVESIQIEPIGDFLSAINSLDYVIPDGWVWLNPDLIKFSEKHSLSIGPFGSNLTVKDYRDAGIPLVFVRDIRTKNFGNETTKFISGEKAQELWAHRVEPGDLLITKMGDPPGDVAVFPLDRPISVITADCIRIKVNPEIVIIKLLSLFIESSLIRSLIKEITAGVAQQKISLQRFRSMPLPIPPLDEQQEIVRRVESLFAYADRLEAHYQAACTQIERLTPVLLAKAFRGELVSQDPNDEPASALLERIRIEQAAQSAKAKRDMTSRKPAMTKMTKESVKEAIRQLPKDKFSFDELRENLTGDYDSLKDILFTLLSEAEPILTQVFDQEERAMCFFRAGK